MAYVNEKLSTMATNLLMKNTRLLQKSLCVRSALFPITYFKYYLILVFKVKSIVFENFHPCSCKDLDLSVPLLWFCGKELFASNYNYVLVIIEDPTDSKMCHWSKQTVWQNIHSSLAVLIIFNLGQTIGPPFP